MTDKELFLKYNMVDVQRKKDDPTLAEDLYYGRIRIDSPKVKPKKLLLLHGSYKCNANCGYCYNQYIRQEYKDAVISETLVRETMRKLGPILGEVTWHGGEPLLLPENLLEALEEEKYKCGLNCITSMQSNYILYSQKKDLINRLGLHVGASFDGLTNTESRGLRSTEAVLRCIAEDPENIVVISVVSKDNKDLLIDNYEYFKSLGLKNIQTNVVHENYLKSGNSYLVSSDEMAVKMLEYVEHWIYDLNSPIYDTQVVGLIKRVCGRVNGCMDTYCVGGWLTMDPFGNISKCGASPMDDPIVNISDIQSYHDLLNHPNYLKLIYQQKKLVDTCSSCEWFHVCHGGCMAFNFMKDKSYTKVDEDYCSYTTKVLNGVYELIKDIDMTRTDSYNPIFLGVLAACNYYSLSEIKMIEGKYKHG